MVGRMKRRVTAICLLAASAVLLVFLVPRATRWLSVHRELRKFGSSDSGEVAAAKARLAEMGSDALPYLVEELASPDSSRAASGRWRSAFEDAFGNVDALESDWKRWLLELEPAS